MSLADYFEREETRGLRDVRVDRNLKHHDDLESLHSRYGRELPLDDTIIPDELRKLRYREIIKRRIMLLVAVLLGILVLYKILN